MLIVTISLVCVVFALLIEFFRRRRNAFKYFERLNIPGPRPHLLWGHYDLLRTIHLEKLDEWCSQFGQTFGMFWGDKPFLVTRDLDLIQRVLVKEFHNFANRTCQFALDSSHPLNSASIFHQRDTAWKQLRGVITPTFTSSKMKNAPLSRSSFDSERSFNTVYTMFPLTQQMVPLIQRGVDEFLSVISGVAETRTPLDVYPLLKRLTVDNISRTAFGIEASTLANPSEVPRILKAALATIEMSNVGWLDLIVNSFRPIGEGLKSLLRFLFRHEMIAAVTDDLFRECQKIVKLRRTSERRTDLLQALLDANEMATDESSLAANADELNESNLNDQGTKKRAKVLTDEEVISNVIIFFLAGYETTSSALGYLLYVLAANPDVQSRLREDVRGLDRDDFYSAVMSCKYLDQVVHETLRLYPPVTSFLTRLSGYTVQHGPLTLPAGLGIYVPVFQLHRDPSIWKDPLEFRPERFQERNYHPMAYQAFGNGPRNCVGMRFALLTIKLLTCNLISSFSLKAVEEMRPTSKYIVSQPDKVVLLFEKLEATSTHMQQ